MSSSEVQQLTLPAGRYTSFVSPASGQAPKRSKKLRSKRSTRWVVNSIIVSLIMLLGGIGLLQNSSSASAGWFDSAIEKVFCGDEAYFYQPSPYTSGLSSLGINNAYFQAANGAFNRGDSTFMDSRHTAYEKYGMSGTTFTTYRGGVLTEQPPFVVGEKISRVPFSKDAQGNEDVRENVSCFALMEVSSTFIANGLFSFTKMITGIATWVYASAYDPAWITEINKAVALMITGDGTVSGLRDVLYFPFLNIMIMLGALYLAWIGLIKKASMQAAQSALWMIGALMVGSLLMFNPSLVSNAANSIVGAVTSATMTATTGLAVGASTENTTRNFCIPGETTVPVNDNLSGNAIHNADSIAAAATEIKEKNDRNTVIRTMQCNLWATFVYSPWVAGQWGLTSSTAWTDGATGTGISSDGKVAIPAGTVQLGGDTTIDSNYPLWQIEQQSLDIFAMSKDNNAQIHDKTQNWFYLADEINLDEPKYLNTWRGGQGGDRIGIATLSVLASTMGLAAVVVLSMSMLAYSIGMSMLIFIGVLFLLVGAHPGFGRGIALRWAELLVGTVLKRIMASALLGVLMAFYAIIMQGTFEFGTAFLAITAISIAGLMYRKTLMSAFTEIHFNGSTNAGIENNQGAGRGMAAMAGLALGAVGSMGAAGKAASAAGAASTLSGVGGKRGKAAAGLAGLGAGAKAMGKGSFNGARSGAITGATSGYGAYRAFKSGHAGADGEANSQESNLDYERKRNDPNFLAREAEQAEKRDKLYAKDYEENHRDIYNKETKAYEPSPWRKAFEKNYPMIQGGPPNPATTSFTGYSLPANIKSRRGQQEWERNRPRDRRPPEPMTASQPSPQWAKPSSPPPRPTPTDSGTQGTLFSESEAQGFGSGPAPMPTGAPMQDGFDFGAASESGPSQADQSDLNMLIRRNTDLGEQQERIIARRTKQGRDGSPQRRVWEKEQEELNKLRTETTNNSQEISKQNDQNQQKQQSQHKQQSSRPQKPNSPSY